eukprot:4212067-Pleurochrysis_carterae.AAC.1
MRRVRCGADSLDLHVGSKGHGRRSGFSTSCVERGRHGASRMGRAVMRGGISGKSASGFGGGGSIDAGTGVRGVVAGDRAVGE